MIDSAPPARRPEFSVVVPSRNRPAQLRRCLGALSRLETPKSHYEVIVVDDGSAEPYESWVNQLNAAMAVRCMRLNGRGPGQARNAGAEAARGRFIALTDDDCEPAPDWLDRIEVALRQNPDAMVGGRTVNVLSGNVCSEASQTLIGYLYDYYVRSGSTNRFFASCNIAMRTELYRRCGGFDLRFRLAGGEDRDFCDRWTSSGLGLLYLPEAVVYHSHRLTLAGFLRQHFTYGRGAWHFHRARAERGGPPVAMEPREFFTGMLAWPFSRPRLSRRMTISILMGVSVGMNILGYAYERWLSRRPART